MLRKALLAGLTALVVGAMTASVAVADDVHQGEIYTNLQWGAFSCTGPNQNLASPAGEFTAVPVGGGMMQVNIHLRNAEPDATYDLTSACHRYIGQSLTTNNHGVGNASFRFTPDVPFVVIDGYVAPQSYDNGGPVGPGYFETTAVPAG